MPWAQSDIAYPMTCLLHSSCNIKGNLKGNMLIYKFAFSFVVLFQVNPTSSDRNWHNSVFKE